MAGAAYISAATLEHSGRVARISPIFMILGEFLASLTILGPRRFETPRPLAAFTPAITGRWPGGCSVLRQTLIGQAEKLNSAGSRTLLSTLQAFASIMAADFWFSRTRRNGLVQHGDVWVMPGNAS